MDAYEFFIDGQFQVSSGDDRIDVEYPYDGSVPSPSTIRRTAATNSA